MTLKGGYKGRDNYNVTVIKTQMKKEAISINLFTTPIKGRQYQI